MFQARGSTKLIIIDAGKTGSEPGAIYEVPGEELAAEREVSYSLHDFRWDHALYMGRKIFKDEFPNDVTVYLIEAGNLDLGLEMTAPVLASARTVIERIKTAITEYE